MKNIKYVLVAASLLAGILSAPVFATAETTTSSTTTSAQLQQLIQSLQQQIATLQAQIKTLNEARSQVQETAKDVSSTFKLINQLRYGMTGDDVKLLQQILATDPDIYPEGHITGKYGKLTENAVKRFQKKACLSQVGTVGPQTMRRINELLQEGAGNSGHVPAGLLRAPGILKKLCGTSTSATTSDTVAPVISAVTMASLASTSATVNWTTNENANGKIYYGTVTPLVVTTTTASVSNAAYTLSHSLTISGLTASTTYYYAVSSADQSGNRALDTEKAFTTTAE